MLLPIYFLTPFPDGCQKWLPIFQFSIVSFGRDNRSIGGRRSILSWEQLWRLWNILASLVCYCRESARVLCLCVRASRVYRFNLTAGISTKYTSGPHSTSGHINAENAAKSHSHKKRAVLHTVTENIALLWCWRIQYIRGLMNILVAWVIWMNIHLQINHVFNIILPSYLEQPIAFWNIHICICEIKNNYNSSINNDSVFHEQHNTAILW